MTKIKNENLGLDHSRLSSTINRVSRGTRIRTFATRDLLNLRNFTIAIFFILFELTTEGEVTAARLSCNLVIKS